MYPIELNEIYKSYRVLIARDVEYLRCMFIQVNERLSLFHSITYPICNMVGVIFTNIVGCSIGELVKARCGQLGVVVNNLLLW